VFRRTASSESSDVQYLLILDAHGNWGFPKGHVEGNEVPLATARREVAEETGLDDLILRGDLDVIDWFFRARRSLIHKFCHLFLFESPGAPARPQLDEGITACTWYPLEEALQVIAHENSRNVLRKASEAIHSVARA
jgi:8-oxo-dGTP pyrophosphatase MutT (NUDIX family)